MTGLEPQISQWRAALLRGRAVSADDADELEAHLRDQLAELTASGLSDDEAFLVAVRRLGEVDAITAEFAREHSDRLWKQLAVAHRGDAASPGLFPMLWFAIGAGALLMLAWNLVGDGAPLLRNLSLFVLPVLAAYFAATRRMRLSWLAGIAATVGVLAVAVNVFPFAQGAQTAALVSIHLPVLLWFVVGVAYVGGEVRSSLRRMDFIRFTGEWAIYYTLIALGGGVLVGLTVAVLSPIAPGVVPHVLSWVVPAGAGGAVVVAAWLVEAKKSVIENLAPVLTAIFTPLFALMLLAAAITYAIAGVRQDFDRDLLVVFDVLLLVVLALILYGISARDALRRAGLMDILRLVAVVAAIVLDALVLASMLQRVGELGFTANRVAALGLNGILLVNLTVTAVLSIRMLAGRSLPARLERWQTGYLVVFASWAAAMVLVLPVVFGFQ